MWREGIIATCDDLHTIESGTALRGLPPRADMISVTVFWSEGGDASYYWAVATP